MYPVQVFWCFSKVGLK